MRGKLTYLWSFDRSISRQLNGLLYVAQNTFSPYVLQRNSQNRCGQPIFQNYSYYAAVWRAESMPQDFLASLHRVIHYWEASISSKFFVNEDGVWKPGRHGLPAVEAVTNKWKI